MILIRSPLSARTLSVGGNSRPGALAVVGLTTRSNLIGSFAGCCALKRLSDFTRLSLRSP